MQLRQTEQAVLGAAMATPEVMDDLDLTPEAFAAPIHGLIWKALRSLQRDGQAIDALAVSDALERAGELDQVGGMNYLFATHQAACAAVNAGHHAKRILDAALRRDLAAMLTRLAATVAEADSGSDVLDMAQEAVMALGQRSTTHHPVSLDDIVGQRLDVLDSRFSGNDDGLETGLSDLDTKLGRIRPGDLLVIAARPGMGKTAISLQIARAMTAKDRPALFFSLEMSAGQLVDRYLSAEGRVNLKKFRNVSFDDQDWAGMTAAVGRAAEANFFVDDHSYSLDQILTTMRRFKRRHGLGVVVIDYLGLVGSRGESREQEVAAITRALKRTAKQLNCVVMALSQLNRKVEDRADRRPQPSDLRESGAIEQDADQILMLYRDAVYNSDSPHHGICEILIRKNRHGETGMVPVIFRADIQRFENHAGHYDPTPYTPMRKVRNAM